MRTIHVLRKPCLKGYSVAENVLQLGTGSLNIDACRIQTRDSFGGAKMASSGQTLNAFSHYEKGSGWVQGSQAGRWPPNLFLEGVGTIRDIDKQGADCRIHSAGSYSEGSANGGRTFFATSYSLHGHSFRIGDSGGASRFFPNFKVDK